MPYQIALHEAVVRFLQNLQEFSAGEYGQVVILMRRLQWDPEPLDSWRFPTSLGDLFAVRSDECGIRISYRIDESVQTIFVWRVRIDVSKAEDDSLVTAIVRALKAEWRVAAVDEH